MASFKLYIKPCMYPIMDANMAIIVLLLLQCLKLPWFKVI